MSHTVQRIGFRLRRLASAVRSFIADTRGVSTVEYALIIVAVVAIIGVAAATLNDTFVTLFGNLQAELEGAVEEIGEAVDGEDE